MMALMALPNDGTMLAESPAMDPAEAVASLRILVAMARADGKIDLDEMALIREMGGDSSMVGETFDVDEELRRLHSPAAKRLTLRAAAAMADVDGKCSKSEHRILQKIHRALGMEDELTLEAVEEEERAKVHRLRENLDSVTAHFLHEVAAKGSALTQSSYEVLVRDLNDRKRGLFHMHAPREE